MKSLDTLEILMFNATSFSERQLCEINTLERSSNLTRAEELEAACWNGLLEEMLSEIICRHSCNDKLFIWQVETRISFLRISIGVCP
jgi:hypothetical protein